MITDNEILRYIGKQAKHTAGFKQLIHDLGIRGRDRRTVQDTLRHMVRRKKADCDWKRALGIADLGVQSKPGCWYVTHAS